MFHIPMDLHDRDDKGGPNKNDNSEKNQKLTITNHQIGEPISDEDSEEQTPVNSKKADTTNPLLSTTYYVTDLNRPTTGNLSLTEAIEANSTLEDFEQQEREIVRQLHGNNKQDSIEDSIKDTIFVPESVQNRQSLLDLRQPSKEEEENQEEDDECEMEFPNDFSLEYPSHAPPPYTSARNSKSIVQNINYNSVPSPPSSSQMNKKHSVIPITIPGINDHSSEDEDEAGNNEFGGMSSINANSKVGNAIGHSFSFAGNKNYFKRFILGDMASAVITKNTQQKSSNNISRPSTADEMYNYSDNIRDNLINPEPTMARYPITSEMKEIFTIIEEFQAERIEIEPLLQPFPVDYIPAVGDVDPFIKIPRPDEVDDLLGLTVLDEPSAIQSDSAMVDLQLHQLSKLDGSAQQIPIKKLSRADKNTHQIQKWIDNVKEVRKIKPPDRAPTSKLDVPLEEYADLCLALVDIPVYKSRIQSLHLLFALYAEFRNSQHFRNLDTQNNLYNNDINSTMQHHDRLEL